MCALSFNLYRHAVLCAFLVLVFVRGDACDHYGIVVDVDFDYALAGADVVVAAAVGVVAVASMSFPGVDVVGIDGLFCYRCKCGWWSCCGCYCWCY